MTAMSEAHLPARQMSLTAAALRLLASIVLANAALIVLARLIVPAILLSKAVLRGAAPRLELMGGPAGQLLLFLGMIAAIAWLRPWQALREASDPPGDEEGAAKRLGGASFLLANLLLFGVASSIAICAAVLFDPRIKSPVNPMTWAFVTLHLFVAACGFWGIRRLKPWVQREPLAPSTRRTNALFGLSGLICVPGTLALALTTMSPDHPFGMFSNSPIPLWVALFAMVSWLVSMAVGWWWYGSADEHERGAYDFGSVVGAGLFTVLAPVWWVAARGGLVPQPDAMVLWLITMIALSIGWYWRRSR